MRAARQVVVEKDNSSEVTTRSFCLREGFVGLARAEASWLTAAGKQTWSHPRSADGTEQQGPGGQGLARVRGAVRTQECGPASAGSS